MPRARPLHWRCQKRRPATLLPSLLLARVVRGLGRFPAAPPHLRLEKGVEKGGWQGRAGGYRRGDDGGQESFIACCLHGRPVSYRGFGDPPRAHRQGRRPGRVVSRAGERERKLKKREGEADAGRRLRRGRRQSTRKSR